MFYMYTFFRRRFLMLLPLRGERFFFVVVVYLVFFVGRGAFSCNCWKSLMCYGLMHTNLGVLCVWSFFGEARVLAQNHSVGRLYGSN